MSVSIVGCGGFKVTGNRFVGEKLDLELDSLAQENANVSQALDQLAEDDKAVTSDFELPEGTLLSMKLDNKCVEDRQKSQGFAAFIGDSIGQKDMLDMQEQNYTYKLKEKMSLEDLDEWAAEDDCLDYITNEATAMASFTPNDSSFSSQAHHKTIRSEQGWDIIRANSFDSQKVVIAVLDTGIQHSHPDLKEVLWKGNADSGRDFTGKGNVEDGHGHGTHVAGLMAAHSNNSTGVAGVAINNIEIMSVKVLGDSGSGSYTGMVNGIRWAADNGAKVINMSLGGTASSAAIKDALEYAVSKGAFVVIAAGNSNQSFINGQKHYPAYYSHQIDGVVSVASINTRGEAKSNFSNYSNQHIEIASPGQNGILSTVIGSKYGTMNGTSMASPVAAGVATAMYQAALSRGQNLTPATLESLMVEGAEARQNLMNVVMGGKLVNLEKAMGLMQSRLTGKDPVPPQQPQPSPNPQEPPKQDPTPPPADPPQQDPNEDPVQIRTQPRDDVVREGRNAYFRVYARGDNLKYQWYKDGKELAGETDRRLRVDDVTMSEVGEYYVKVYNGSSSVISNKAKLTLR